MNERGSQRSDVELEPKQAPRGGMGWLSRAIEGLAHHAFGSDRTTRHRLVGEARVWKAKRRFQIDFLRSQGLQPQHSLLDVGCGTLRGGIALIDYLDEQRYVGVEIRAEALDEGRRELADAGLEWKRPELVQSDDLRALHLNRSFDFVWAFSVLIHMTDDVLNDCFGFVRRHLAPDGTFLANVNVGADNQAGVWREFPVIRRNWATYEEIARSHGFAVQNVGCLSDLGDCGNNCIDAGSRIMLSFRSVETVR